MDAVFYFRFFQPNYTARHLGFCISPLTQTWSETAEKIYECEHQLEHTYGVHNWLTTLSDRVNVFGYVSCEVQPHQQDELMEKWRQAFLHMIPTCVVSDVFVLDINTWSPTPVEIFQNAQNAHEVQQAQLLRDKLSSHLPTASTAATKKI